MADHNKLVIIATHGPQDPELATIPFVMAVAALASDVETVIGFQADGVCLVHQGVAETVQAPGLPPLAKLIDDVRELGGSLLVCAPCVKSRGSPTRSSTAPRSSPPRVSSRRSPRPPALSSTSPEGDHPMITITTLLSETELAALTAPRSSTPAAPPAPARCSRPRRAWAPCPSGSVIEIWSSDPVTKTDIGAWSGKVGHEFLGVARTADGYDRVFVRRGK